MKIQGHFSVQINNLRFFFGPAQNPLVIDAGEDNVAGSDMWFVFFSFLDSAVFSIKICKFRKALDRLLFKIAIRHGMADNGSLDSRRAQIAAKPACRLRLADARSHCANGDHRQF